MDWLQDQGHDPEVIVNWLCHMSSGFNLKQEDMQGLDMDMLAKAVRICIFLYVCLSMISYFVTRKTWEKNMQYLLHVSFTCAVKIGTLIAYTDR